jgi:hypothetical protein
VVSNERRGMVVRGGAGGAGGVEVGLRWGGEGGPRGEGEGHQGRTNQPCCAHESGTCNACFSTTAPQPFVASGWLVIMMGHCCGSLQCGHLTHSTLPTHLLPPFCAPAHSCHAAQSQCPAVHSIAHMTQGTIVRGADTFADAQPQGSAVQSR